MAPLRFVEERVAPVGRYPVTQHRHEIWKVADHRNDIGVTCGIGKVLRRSILFEPGKQYVRELHRRSDHHAFAVVGGIDFVGLAPVEASLASGDSRLPRAAGKNHCKSTCSVHETSAS